MPKKAKFVVLCIVDNMGNILCLLLSTFNWCGVWLAYMVCENAKHGQIWLFVHNILYEYHFVPFFVHISLVYVCVKAKQSQICVAMYYFWMVVQWHNTKEKSGLRSATWWPIPTCQEWATASHGKSEALDMGGTHPWTTATGQHWRVCHMSHALCGPTWQVTPW